MPTSPGPDTSPIREGHSGEVPLRLFLCEDGTLEVRAQAPRPLPEELEIRRDEHGGPRVEALNPATARRMWAHAEVRRRLEALFEVAPRAQGSRNAVRLELAPEQNRELVRSTAAPELLEGGRRFIKLDPEKPRLAQHQRSRCRGRWHVRRMEVRRGVLRSARGEDRGGSVPVYRPQEEGLTRLSALTD